MEADQPIGHVVSTAAVEELRRRGGGVLGVVSRGGCEKFNKRKGEKSVDGIRFLVYYMGKKLHKKGGLMRW